MVKVINIKLNARDTIAGAGVEPAVKKQRLSGWVTDILNQLPAKIVETPYRSLPWFLTRAIVENKRHSIELLDRVEIGRVKPKAAHLLALLTTTQKLRRKLNEVPQAHRKAIVERIRRVGSQRSARTFTDRNLGFSHYDLDLLERENKTILDAVVEVLELGLTSFCNDPEPLSKKQAQILLRKHALLSILEAFHRADKKLDRNGIITVAKALARGFPDEAGLATISPSMVKRIIRTKNPEQELL
jgi:hypothetical protein